MFNLSGIWRGARASANRVADSLDSFASERAPAVASSVRVARWPSLPAVEVAAGIVLCLAIIGGFLLHTWVTARPTPPFAVVTIESDPAGALVLMQGIPKGITPLALSIPAGDNAFEVVHEGREKPLRVVARLDTNVVHHVQFEPRELDTGTPRPTPVVAAQPAPTAPTAAAGSVGGWLTVSVPIPVQILENNQVVGTSAAQRVMLPAGTKRLRFVNESLGFSAERTVQLAPGKTESVSLQVPRAPLSINAVPWAEVWLGGVRIGETPIGNHMVPLGTHELVFRHPQLGERRHVVTVGLKSPARVSVDLRKPQ